MFKFLLKILVLITLVALVGGIVTGSETLINVGSALFITSAVIFGFAQPFVLYNRFIEHLDYDSKTARRWLYILFSSALILSYVIYSSLPRNIIEVDEFYYYKQASAPFSFVFLTTYFFIGTCMYFYTVDFGSFSNEFDFRGKNILNHFPNVILIMEIVGFISAVLGIISFFR